MPVLMSCATSRAITISGFFSKESFRSSYLDSLGTGASKWVPPCSGVHSRVGGVEPSARCLAVRKLRQFES